MALPGIDSTAKRDDKFRFNLPFLKNWIFDCECSYFYPCNARTFTHITLVYLVTCITLVLQKMRSYPACIFANLRSFKELVTLCEPLDECLTFPTFLRAAWEFLASWTTLSKPWNLLWSWTTCVTYCRCSVLRGWTRARWWSPRTCRWSPSLTWSY